LTEAAIRPPRWQYLSANTLYLLVFAVVVVESLIGYVYAFYDPLPPEYTARRLWMLGIYLPSVLVLMFFSRLTRRPSIANIRLSAPIVAAFAAFWISLSLNGVRPTPLVVAAPFIAKYVFYGLRRVPLSLTSRPFVVALTAFTAAPILIYLFYPELRQNFVFHDNTFRGFGASRADFGYLLGLAVMLLACDPSAFLKLLLPVLAYGIWLTESRATLVALGLTLPIIGWYRYRQQFRWIVGLTIVCVPVFLIVSPPRVQAITTTRGDFFVDWGGRFELARNGLVQAAQTNLFFGNGRLYNTVLARDGTFKEVHNGAVQSIVNFGLILTVIWYGLIARSLRRLNGAGKAFILFLVVFGLFQPGFEPWFFAPQVLFTFLLGESVSRGRA
jgi:hypothetical protein